MTIKTVPKSELDDAEIRAVVIEGYYPDCGWDPRVSEIMDELNIQSDIRIVFPESPPSIFCNDGKKFSELLKEKLGNECFDVYHEDEEVFWVYGVTLEETVLALEQIAGDYQ